jgi:hypothetical protein
MLIRSGLCHGRGARSQPPPGQAWHRTGTKGLPRSSGWTGGWAWKGPGHPVDNGDQARGQRDGLRSEGAARVLFLPGFLARPQANQARIRGWFRCLRGGRAPRQAGAAIVSRGGDIMACTVRD